MPNELDTYIDRLYAATDQLTQAVDSTINTLAKSATDPPVPPLTRHQQDAAFSESLYLLIHFTDRAVVQALRESGIDAEHGTNIVVLINQKAMETAIQRRWKLSTSHPDYPQLLAAHHEALGTRFEFYVPFVAFKPGAPKGDLFWEFGKQMARTLGHDNNFVIVSGTELAATSAIQTLDPRSFVNALLS